MLPGREPAEPGRSDGPGDGEPEGPVPGDGELEWLPLGDGELDGVLVGDVGGGPAISTVALPVTLPRAITPRKAQVTVADSVAVSPARAERGTGIWACSSAAWFAPSIPTAQVCVPSPAPQEVKAGAGQPGSELDADEMRTVIRPAAQPVGQTRIPYWAACPGSAVLVAGCTLTHSATADAGETDGPASAPLGAEPRDGRLTGAPSG
jgi:hypothetical protein